MPPPTPGPPTTPKSTTTTSTSTSIPSDAPSTTYSPMADSTTSEPTPPVSTTSSEIPKRGPGRESGGHSGAQDEPDEPCPFLDDCLWCLIALIVLDVLLIIILIILIILVRRGSKKMKAATMAKKHRKSETMVATEGTKIKSHIPSKKNTETETGTTMGGQAGGDETEYFTVKGKGKATSKVSKDGTKFFTVDSEFQTPSKKKNKKKGKK